MVLPLLKVCIVNVQSGYTNPTNIEILDIEFP